MNDQRMNQTRISLPGANHVTMVLRNAKLIERFMGWPSCLLPLLIKKPSITVSNCSARNTALR